MTENFLHLMREKVTQVQEAQSPNQDEPKEALADVAQWIEHWPVNQRVTGLIPSQGTCLGCGPGP